MFAEETTVVTLLLEILVLKIMTNIFTRAVAKTRKS